MPGVARSGAEWRRCSARRKEGSPGGFQLQAFISGLLVPKGAGPRRRCPAMTGEKYMPGRASLSCRASGIRDAAGRNVSRRSASGLRWDSTNASLGSWDVERPRRWVTSTLGVKTTFLPWARMRAHRSTSSEYRKNDSSKPPIVASRSRRVIRHAPLTQSTSRSRASRASTKPRSGPAPSR